MKLLSPALALAAFMGLLPVNLSAQEGGTRAEYQASANLDARFKDKVFLDRLQAHWLPGDTQFWYEIKTGPRTRQFLLVDALQGSRQPAFDHARLCEALAAAAQLKDLVPDALPLADLALKPAENALEFRAANKTWRCDLATYAITEIAAPANPRGRPFA
jgi:dipeptidyl-peptidase-4